MNTINFKFWLCLYLMCSLTLSVSAQVESVRGPKKRTTSTTTTQQRQNYSTQQSQNSSTQQSQNSSTQQHPNYSTQQSQNSSTQQSQNSSTQQRPNYSTQQSQNSNIPQGTSGSTTGTRQRAEILSAASVIITSQRVDLGLSVYWAGYNVGASSPEEYGSYFAWGETSPKSSYDRKNSATDKKKIRWLQSHDYLDSQNNLTLAHDAARANWGGNWRMPTKEEFDELKKYCIWEWGVYGGKKGYKVTGINGNAIFLPAAGFRSGTSIKDAGKGGCYWSSSHDGSYDIFAWYLNFPAGGISVNATNRACGLTVRPVLNKY